MRLGLLPLGFLLLLFSCQSPDRSPSSNSAYYPEETSYRSAYYDQKVSEFDSLPILANEVIWLGDSITDGADWSLLFPAHNTQNFGISADNTFGVLRRLSQVTRRQPSKLFILVGINDVAMNTPVSVILSNYKKIVKQVKGESPNTQIYIQSLLPTNNDYADFPRHQNKTQIILYINHGLSELAASESTNYVNLYPAFLNGAGKLDPTFTDDGLHLNSAGSLNWKNELIAYIP